MLTVVLHVLLDLCVERLCRLIFRGFVSLTRDSETGVEPIWDYSIPGQCKPRSHQ